MSPEEIGLEYVRAASILRETQEFGMRDAESLSLVSHTWNEQRTEIHENSEAFARQVQRMALQVLGDISDYKFGCDFVVNLEAFSRIYAEEDDVERLRQIASWYVPVRLKEYLRIPDDYDPETALSVDASLTEASFDDSRGIEETKEGLRIHRRIGFLTSGVIIAVSCVPAIIYLALRATSTDVENAIQTTLAILASTLFILASPVHKSLFNNWQIGEALTGRMTLDEDSVLNIKLEKERHDVGAGLIAMRKMSLLSNKASYASPYSNRGLNPGPMELTILTRPASHLLIVDQDGTLVLMYDDDHGVELLVHDHAAGNTLKAREYNGFRYWHVVKVPAAARKCLVY